MREIHSHHPVAKFWVVPLLEGESGRYQDIRLGVELVPPDRGNRLQDHGRSSFAKKDVIVLVCTQLQLLNREVCAARSLSIQPSNDVIGFRFVAGIETLDMNDVRLRGWIDLMCPDQLAFPDNGAAFRVEA